MDDAESGSLDAYRLSLVSTVGALCHECGFEATDKLASETLTEMLQSFLSQLARSAKHYAELSNRTEVSVSDVSLSLVQMGFRLDSFKEYAGRRGARTPLFAAPAKAKGSSAFRTLQLGVKEQLPAYMPDYMPPFPDRHAYIQTPARKAPVADYQTVRELAASQKRDVENALTKFIAKTGDAERLWGADDNDGSGGGGTNSLSLAFPLIACKPCALPYLSALLPRDDALSSYDVGGGEESAESAAAAVAAAHAKRRKLETADDGATREFDEDGQPCVDVTDNPYARPPVVAS